MTRFAESYAAWLADYYLLATILLALALISAALLKQPAQRLMVTKSTLVALVLLAILCAVPGWSLVHLMAAERPTAHVEPVYEEPMSHADSLAHPESSQANPVPQTAQPAVPPQPADETPIQPVEPKMSWSAMFAIAHLAGMGCIAVWLALGWVASVRLRKTAQTAPANISAILSELASHNSRTPKPLQLFTHDRIDVAVALGVWQPMILLPNRWANSQSHDRLQAVLAHEATHVLNHDLQWVALARILFVALWANPLFWLTKRRLRLDQEALADAAAAEITSRQQYAEQLVAWARDTRSRPALHLSSAVGLWEGPSQLRQRIAILLDEKLTVLRNCSRRWRITAGVFAIGAATALSMVTLQPAIQAEEKKPAATSTTDPNSQKALVEMYRKHFKTPEPNVVGGFVVDEKLQPIAGAKVSLYRTNWRDMTQKLITEKTTDDEGKVRFDQVFDIANEFPGGKIPPDDGIGEELLEVVVRAPGRVPDYRFQPRQLVAKRGEPLMLIMPPATTLRGRVTGPDGKPVAGALVAVGKGAPTGWAGAEPMTSRSDADGNYVIDDVPHFDLKAQAEQEAAMRSRKDAATNAFQASPQVLILTVEHPNFAVGKAQIEKTPGTTDIQLQPAAILAGRIVFGDSGKPAGGARVWVAGHHQKLSETKRDDAGNNDEQQRYAMPFYTTSAHTDADGKYRLASLPPGYYHIVADMPGWVNIGLRDISAEPGKTNEVFDLTLTKGGTVSIRLIDAKTREPISVPPEAQALIGNSEAPIFDRPPIDRRVPANKNGLFELALPAGKHELYVAAVYVGEDRKWMGGAATPTESSNVVVTVTDSKTMQVDLPVIDAKSAKVTGAYVPGPLPKEQPKAGNQPDAAMTLIEQAQRLTRDGKPLEAIKLLNAVLDKDSDNMSALGVRAEAWHTLGEDRKEIADYKQILKLKPPLLQKMVVWNNLAFILATSPDERVRDGKRAVEIAETAKLLQPTPTPDVFDTLAAAYAEAGQFDSAVKAEQEAIKLAPEAQREEFGKYLKLYEAHKPRRETRATSNQPAQPADKNGGTSPNRSGAAAKTASVEVPVVVAKHVMLLNGKEVITWNELDAKIAALPDPSNAYPHVYVTQGATESGLDKDAKSRTDGFFRKFKLKEASQTPLAPRTSFQYDQLRSKADLIPDESRRANGTVVDSKGNLVTNAEVVLITPVDDSISHKTVDVYLARGRLRNRLEEVVTDTEAVGRFAVYPPPNTPYYLVALHDDGFGLMRSDSFAESHRLEIQPWARIEGRIAKDPSFPSMAAADINVPAVGKWPNLSFHEYTSDIDQPAPDGSFVMSQVPPLLEGALTRSISHEYDAFRLTPGQVLKVADPKNPVP